MLPVYAKKEPSNSPPIPSCSSPFLPIPLLYFHSNYESTVNNQKVTWQLNGRSLEIANSSGIKMSVRVLGEELAYNKSLKQFRMFIIDRPLDPNYKVTSV